MLSIWREGVTMFDGWLTLSVVGTGDEKGEITLVFASEFQCSQTI